nr:EOG090X0D30 [Eubosmina coregoni]
MGKGFNNYMCKKFFHPGSRDNLKRVWMAQQKTEADKKKQDELKAQYEKEQDLYVNKSLVSKESKEKLSVNFMYEPPPGMKKEREREDGEPEFKFEWQRKYNAPREDYCKGDEDIRDQPFGIAVRNVRCIKCHTWGHVNTDRECPMFNKARDEYDEAIASQQPASNDKKLMSDMKETGLAMTRSAINTLEQMQVPMQELNKKEEVPEEDLAFLKTLTTKDKKKLLKKLEKLENKGKEKKKKRKEKKKKREERSPSSSSSSSSAPPTPEPEQKKAHKHNSSKKYENGDPRHQSQDSNRSRSKRDNDDRHADHQEYGRESRNHSKRDSVEDDRRRSRGRRPSPDIEDDRRNHGRRPSPDVENDRRRNHGRRASPEPRDHREKRSRHDSGDRSNRRRH